MALDDIKSIDFVLDPTPHAKLTLLIVDGVPHADEEARFNKFLKKLGAYVAYIIGPTFATDHPGVEPNDVLIGVLCAQPPNAAMKEMTEVRPAGKPDVSIRVICTQWRPGDEIPWFIRPDGVAPT